MHASIIIQSNAPPSISPDGDLIALLVDQQLEIHKLHDLELIRTVPTDVKRGLVKWSICAPEEGFRFLLHTPEDVRVWDLMEPKWSSVITNGSGGMGRIMSAEFGPVKQELILMNDFGSKMTIWSLISGRSVEIRDPKTVASSYGFRPGSGHLAFLSRPAAQDILTIHQPGSYSVIRSIPLLTVDAQGLKWSPDGKWLAIWDTASAGTKVQILTADGAQFRIVSSGNEAEEASLGVKSLSWSPTSQQLAIGDYNQQVTILSARTFSPIMSLAHCQTIDLSNKCPVWQELSANNGQERSYQAAPQPIALPPSILPSSDPTLKVGISVVSYDATGALLATKDDASPSTVWIWNVASKGLEAVLIQLAPIKKLQWHPKLAGLLHIHVELEGFVHIFLWRQSDIAPHALPAAFERSSSRLEIKWVDKSDLSEVLLINDDRHSMFCWPFGKPVKHRDEGGDDSLDSVYEALTGEAGPSP